MNSRIFFIFIFCLFFKTSIAQTKTFKWTFGSGEYDSTKISEPQILDTYALMDFNPGSSIEELSRPDKHLYNPLRVRGGVGLPSKDYKDISIDSQLVNLHADYKFKLNYLSELNGINSSKWDSIRKCKLRDLEFWYKVKLTTLQFKNDPKILYQNFPDDSCAFYNSLLTARRSRIVKYYKSTVSEFCKTRQDSSSCYKQSLRGKNKLKEGRRAILNNWRSCIYVWYYNHEYQFDYYNEFKNVFTNLQTFYFD